MIPLTFVYLCYPKFLICRETRGGLEWQQLLRPWSKNKSKKKLTYFAAICPAVFIQSQDGFKFLKFSLLSEVRTYKFKALSSLA